MVFGHAFHVLLYNCFYFVFVSEGMRFERLSHQRVAAELVGAHNFLTIELYQCVSAQVLVYSVGVVDGPGAVGGGLEQILTESHIRAGMAQHAEDCRHDVYLLSYAGHYAFRQFATGVEDQDWTTIYTYRSAV